jgi:hypothetical protein
MVMDAKKSAIIQNLQRQAEEIDRINKKIKDFETIFRNRLHTPAEEPAQHPPPQQDVERIILQGRRGGLYYVNANDRKVYLTPAQCRRCIDGDFGTAGCPPQQEKQCPLTKQQLKGRVKKLERKVERLKSRY